MKTKLLILKKMMSAKKDKLDNVYCVGYWYPFYEFQELSKLDKTDYETLLKEMRNEGLIIIDMNKSANFDFARIVATAKGEAYLIEHEQ